jgi:hypothetical protein
MEKFMYLFIDGPSQSSMPSPEQMQATMQKWFTWIDKLKSENRYINGEPLLPEGKIINGTKKVITDGPFTESKELVSGFVIIEAKDIKEATELAKDCPIFESNGSLAVRPVQKINR